MHNIYINIHVILQTRIDPSLYTGDFLYLYKFNTFLWILTNVMRIRVQIEVDIIECVT